MTQCVFLEEQKEEKEDLCLVLSVLKLHTGIKNNDLILCENSVSAGFVKYFSDYEKPFIREKLVTLVEVK